MISITRNPTPRVLSAAKSRATVLATLALAVTTACGGIGVEPEVVSLSPALASITVTPNATMATSSTQQMIAVGRDASGQIVMMSPTWSVVAQGGTVDATGLFTSGAVSGTFTNTVRASSGGMSGFATVIVTSAAVATVLVTPNPLVLAAGSSVRLSATGIDDRGITSIVTPQWYVVGGGGSINLNTGLFTAGADTGTFRNTIRAGVGSLTGSATVTVTAPVIAQR
jgi:hypothetical protein